MGCSMKLLLKRSPTEDVAIDMGASILGSLTSSESTVEVVNVAGLANRRRLLFREHLDIHCTLSHALLYLHQFIVIKKIQLGKYGCDAPQLGLQVCDLFLQLPYSAFICWVSGQGIIHSG